MAYTHIANNAKSAPMQYFVFKTTSSVCHISMNLYLCADNSTKTWKPKVLLLATL